MKRNGARYLFLMVVLSCLGYTGALLYAQTGPLPPINLTTRIGDKTAIIRWEAAERGIFGYYIYWSTNATGPFTSRTTVMQTQPYWVENSLQNNKTYYYKISAVNASFIEGEPSTPIAVTPQELSDEEFLNLMQQTAFDFFWNEANPEKGLIRDRSQRGSHASTASVGFGLPAIAVGIERGWITREAGRQRVLNTLRFFADVPTDEPSNSTGYKGFYYHFLNMTGGYREWSSELSTIDTALLLGGILFAKEYFSGNDAAETEIRDLATKINDRADWKWASPRAPRVSHGWKPESGLLPYDWAGFSEASILYIIGLGSPTYPLPATSWSAWTSTYTWQSHYGQSFVIFPPLFGHQYSHIFIDFRGIKDSYMNARGSDYFENAKRATLAQRAYCIANPKGFTDYGPNLWGITASDVPGGYKARGAPPDWGDDGTLNPTAPGGSFPFTPNESLAALREMYNRYRLNLWGAYGLKDAFNPTKNWFATDYIGIDQGPILLMIENHRTGLIWKYMMKSEVIQRGLRRAGFKGPGVANEAEIPPNSSTLIQSYPNPFSDELQIDTAFPHSGLATLEVFDVLGRAKHQEQKFLESGLQSWRLAGGEWPDGAYFVRITLNETVKVIKVIRHKESP